MRLTFEDALPRALERTGVGDFIVFFRRRPVVICATEADALVAREELRRLVALVGMVQ